MKLHQRKPHALNVKINFIIELIKSYVQFIAECTQLEMTNLFKRKILMFDIILCKHYGIP